MVRHDSNGRFLYKLRGGERRERLAVGTYRASLDNVQVRPTAPFEGVVDGSTGLEKRGHHARVAPQGKRSLVARPGQRKEPIRPFGTRDLLLFDGRVQVKLFGEEPHLDESHRLVGEIVDLGMPHASSDGGMLYPPLPQHAPEAPFVLVAELARGDVGDHFVVPVRVKRPGRSRAQRVVVEDPEPAKLDELGVRVIAEGEVPTAIEGPVLDITMSLVDGVRESNYDDGPASRRIEETSNISNRTHGSRRNQTGHRVSDTGR